jgi:prevent-host-death family protein
MELGVFEARNRFSERVEAAERGEETIVLKHGRAVARLVPYSNDARVNRRLDALDRAAELRRRIVAETGRPFTHEELVAARDEGRR